MYIFNGNSGNYASYNVGTNNTFCNNGYDIDAEWGAYAYAISNIYSGPLPSSIYGNVFVTGINGVCGLSKALVGTDAAATEEPSPELKDADEKYLALLRKMREDKSANKYDANNYVKEHQKLIDAYKKCVKEGTEKGVIKAALSKVSHLYKGLGDYQGFTDYITEALTSGNFKSAESYFKRYFIWDYVGKKQYENALKTEDEVLTSAANDEKLMTEMLYEKGITYRYYFNDDNKALEMYESIVSQYPTSPLRFCAETEMGLSVSSAVRRTVAEKSQTDKSIRCRLSNYPNPFNPTTSITFSTPNDGMVSLKVFDVLGREVATLVNEYRTAGSYQVNFNASSLPSGVYLYKLEAVGKSLIQKMMLMK